MRDCKPSQTRIKSGCCTASGKRPSGGWDDRPDYGTATAKRAVPASHELQISPICSPVCSVLAAGDSSRYIQTRVFSH